MAASGAGGVGVGDSRFALGLRPRAAADAPQGRRHHPQDVRDCAALLLSARAGIGTGEGQAGGKLYRCLGGQQSRYGHPGCWQHDLACGGIGQGSQAAAWRLAGGTRREFPDPALFLRHSTADDRRLRLARFQGPRQFAHRIDAQPRPALQWPAACRHPGFQRWQRHRHREP